MSESEPAPRKALSRVFYAAGILLVSSGVLAVAWLFRQATASLLLLTGAWVLVVVAFAWDIATRAAHLDEAVHSRTDSLERTNTYLSRLLEQLRAFRRISYDINQRMELEEVAAEFTAGVESLFPEVDSAWLWLDRRLLRADEGGADRDRLSPLDLAAQAGAEWAARPSCCGWSATAAWSSAASRT